MPNPIENSRLQGPPQHGDSEYWDATVGNWVLATGLPGSTPAPLHFVSTTTQAVPATANINTYASLPTPLSGSLTFAFGTDIWTCLAFLSAYIDTASNNIEVALDLNVTGASTYVAGSKTENRLHVTGKQPVGVALTEQAVITVNPGTTNIELMHAGGAHNLSDITFTIIPLHPTG